MYIRWCSSCSQSHVRERYDRGGHTSGSSELWRAALLSKMLHKIGTVRQILVMSIIRIIVNKGQFWWRAYKYCLVSGKSCRGHDLGSPEHLTLPANRISAHLSYILDQWPWKHVNTLSCGLLSLGLATAANFYTDGVKICSVT